MLTNEPVADRQKESGDRDQESVKASEQDLFSDS